MCVVREDTEINNLFIDLITQEFITQNYKIKQQERKKHALNLLKDEKTEKKNRKELITQREKAKY